MFLFLSKCVSKILWRLISPWFQIISPNPLYPKIMHWVWHLFFKSRRLTLQLRQRFMMSSPPDLLDQGDIKAYLLSAVSARSQRLHTWYQTWVLWWVDQLVHDTAEVISNLGLFCGHYQHPGHLARRRGALLTAGGQSSTAAMVPTPTTHPPRRHHSPLKPIPRHPSLGTPSICPTIRYIGSPVLYSLYSISDLI